MGQLVEEHHIVFGGQRLQRADARGVTAAEDQRGFRAFEGGEFFFQLRMRPLRSGDQARGAGARAEIARGADGGFDDLRMPGETEVIVRGEVVQRCAVESDGRSGRRVGDAEAPSQTALFQIVQFLLQEVFEHGGRGFLTAEGAESTEERF